MTDIPTERTHPAVKPHVSKVLPYGNAWAVVTQEEGVKSIRYFSGWRDANDWAYASARQHKMIRIWMGAAGG